MIFNKVFQKKNIMSEGDRIKNTNDNEVQNLNVSVKHRRFLYIVLILGIIGAGVLDFPRNIAELTGIGFSLSWGIFLAIILSLFKIAIYLTFPLFVYYLLIDVFKKVIKDGVLFSLLLDILLKLQNKQIK